MGAVRTARTIQTNLASTSSASFNGTANVTPGVTGTLPVSNGGTGQTNLTNVTVGAANKATLDGSGNNINTTYVKSVTQSGGTVTVTKGNGTTNTFTVSSDQTAIKNISGEWKNDYSPRIKMILTKLNDTTSNVEIDLDSKQLVPLAKDEHIGYLLTTRGLNFAPEWTKNLNLENFQFNGALPIANGGTGSKWGLVNGLIVTMNDAGTHYILTSGTNLDEITSKNDSYLSYMHMKFYHCNNCVNCPAGHEYGVMFAFFNSSNWSLQIYITRGKSGDKDGTMFVRNSSNKTWKQFSFS